MKQKPFLAAQLKQLKANAITGAATGSTAAPVVKFFCPWNNCTWLICEAEDHDEDMILFGLCDLGVGCPEIGSVMLSDLTAMKHFSGLTIERDLHFTPNKTLTEYADAAREAGGITA